MNNIHFAHQLLQHQFPSLDGLQPTVLSQNNGFYPVTHESVQIHYTGHFHWVTSCSIGGEIQVYDSRFAVGPLSPSLQIQLAQIYRVSIQEEEDGDKFLTVKVPAVQQQTRKVAYLPLHLHTMLQVETIQQNYSSSRRECGTIFYSASRSNNSHQFLTRFWPSRDRSIL